MRKFARFERGQRERERLGEVLSCVHFKQPSPCDTRDRTRLVVCINRSVTHCVIEALEYEQLVWSAFKSWTRVLHPFSALHLHSFCVPYGMKIAEGISRVGMVRDMLSRRGVGTDISPLTPH